MSIVSFLKDVSNNVNLKNIHISFESQIDGYRIIETRGRLETIGMNIENCKLKNFEEKLKKFTKQEIIKRYPDINGIVNLSLDFRLNKVYISGDKVVLTSIKNIDLKQSSSNCKLENNTTTKADINNRNTKNKINSTNTVKTKNNSKKSKKRKKKKKKKK